ncbi:MAG TPA: phage tail protein [bacterium]|nr:phage tail protein [bacterium]
MSIAPSISLKGEKEFRQAISSINNEMKVLGSEMVKVSSSFDKGDKSVEALTARNQVLEQQMDKQKEKISTVREALKSATEQYGETDKRTLKWQQTLNYAEADLNKMSRELDKNNKSIQDAGTSADGTVKPLRDMGKEAETAGEKTSVLGDVIKGKLIADAIIAGVKGLGNALKSMATGLKDMAVDSAKYADEIQTLADVTGLSTEKAQEFKYMTEMIDVSFDTLSRSMARNIRSMSDYANGSAKATEAYDKLGIQVLNTDGSLRDSQEVYFELIDALGQVENETERDAIAMDLMGRSAQDLNPLIKAGSDAMRELGQEAHDMGYVLGQEALDDLVAFDDGMHRITNAMDALKHNIGAVMAPALGQMAEEIARRGGEFAKSIQEAEGDISQIGEIIGDTVLEIVEDIIDAFPDMLDAAMGFIDTFVSGLLDKLPDIVETGMELIMVLVASIIDMLPDIIAVGMDVLIALVDGLAKALPDLIPVTIQAIMTIVHTILDNLPELIRVAMDMIMALTMGLIDAIPELIEAIPIIIDALIKAIVTMLPEIIVMGMVLTVELAKGLIKAIPDLVRMIPQIIKSIVDGLKVGIGSVKGVGGDLIKGLWQGIQDSMNWLWDKITGFGQTVVGWVQDVFKIGSPSKVMADDVGWNLGLGVGVGFEKSMQQVKRDMASAIPMSFEYDIPSATTNEVHLHIGNFIGDEYGLKQLERMLKDIRLQENMRLGTT